MKRYSDPVWFGNQDSFKTVADAYNFYLENPTLGEAVLKDMAAAAVMENPFVDSEDEYEPFFDLLQEFDGVGIVNITGSLVAEDSWVNSLFGLTSYESIINAVSYLAENDSISRIVLNIDSGGGTTSGIEAAGEAVKRAREFKPVDTHVNGSAFSAAYWIASASEKINATKMSEVGSIGVLLTHKAMYKYLEDRGYDVTIITAGKYKGIGHPAKPLSDSDKAYLQDKADTLYKFFLEMVSGNRESLSIATKDSWAEGRTFFAEDGVEVGLVDTVQSTNDFFNSIIDKPASQTNNSGVTYHQETTMPKSVMLKNSATQAALASGAPLESLEHEVVEDGDQEGASTEAAGTTTEDTEGAAASETSAESGQGENESEQMTASSMDGLVTKIADLSAQNASLKAENDSLEAKLSDLSASSDALKAIAIEAVHKMQVAMRSTPMEMSELPAATIVAQHKKVKEQFESYFKVGQSSASVASDEDDSPDAFKLGIVPKAS